MTWTVNERSACAVNVAFVSEDEPTEVRCRIDCLTSGQVVREWSTVDSSLNVGISISSAENAMRNDGLRGEMRRVTVEATFPDGEQITGDYDYAVRNLRFI
jgi:hypothetical protein